MDSSNLLASSRLLSSDLPYTSNERLCLSGSESGLAAAGLPAAVPDFALTGLPDSKAPAPPPYTPPPIPSPCPTTIPPLVPVAEGCPLPCVEAAVGIALTLPAPILGILLPFPIIGCKFGLNGYFFGAPARCIMSKTWSPVSC